MNRLGRAILLAVIGAALALWFGYLRRSGLPVQALEQVKVEPRQIESSNPSRESSNPSRIPEESAPLPPTVEADAPLPSEDIIPIAPQPAARTAPEAVAGPEIEPGLTPYLVMQNVRSVIRDYSARFGGNPFGNNREITAQLNGGNLKQVVFLNPEDGMRLNSRGELVDNWGTPFFFHQISRTEMEIHSAGPDKRMWTEDDLVIKW